MRQEHEQGSQPSVRGEAGNGPSRAPASEPARQPHADVSNSWPSRSHTRLGTFPQPTPPPHSSSRTLIDCHRSKSPERATGCRTSPSAHAYFDPALRDDTASPSPSRARPHNAHTRQRRLKRDPTNARRPPATPCTASTHPCRSPGPCRAPTSHPRTPHTGTIRTHTSRRARTKFPETSLFAYGSRARTTPAARSRPVHMAWDREAQPSTPW